jgi:hypothetical protein
LILVLSSHLRLARVTEWFLSLRLPN